MSDVFRELIKLTQAWAMRGKFDPQVARDLRHRAILNNHAHYLESIPVYRRFASEEGIGASTDVETITRRLMSTDDLFKSYDQRWLDDRDFGRMNTWLGEIFHRRVEVDIAGVDSMDGWIDRLALSGIRLIYSSGTSGNFSFVPRDAEAWELFRNASTATLTPLLFYEKVGTTLQRLLVRVGLQLFSPETFASLARRSGSGSAYDAVFLDFTHGRTGNQTLEQELAPFFRRVTYLYETDLSPSLLRLATRGPKLEPDRVQLEKLQDVVIGQREQNYARVIASLKRSSAEGQMAFIFGTTHQYKELCEAVHGSQERLSLLPGSLVLFGGGWKSFTGERISRQALLGLMSESLGLPAERILEGYSMTEMNAFTLRCDYGRFHIPPLIEPVIFDEALEPVKGNDLQGVFGFLDPLAIAYPGFIISGDEVHYVDGECACGLSGPAVTEIGRARAREVKGCGGIMASIAA